MEAKEASALDTAYTVGDMQASQDKADRALAVHLQNFPESHVDCDLAHAETCGGDSSSPES